MCEFLSIIAIIWLVMGGLGAFVAMKKGRSPTEGLIMGFLFGPFGVLITALLPTNGDLRQTVPTGFWEHRAGQSKVARGSATNCLHWKIATGTFWKSSNPNGGKHRTTGERHFCGTTTRS